MTPEDAKADVKPKCEPTLQLGMRLRGGGSEGGGESRHASGEESGEEESGGEGSEESGEEGSEPDESGSDADDTVDPNRILPKGTRRSRQEPDRFRHEDHASTTSVLQLSGCNDTVDLGMPQALPSAPQPSSAPPRSPPPSPPTLSPQPWQGGAL